MAIKVICIKLTSGEEIIGRVCESTSMLLGSGSVVVDRFGGHGPWKAEGSVTIESVRGITAQQMGKNEMAIAFFPWSLANQDCPFIINLETMAVSIYPAEDAVETGYLEQTSKIQIARGTPGIKM